MGKVKKVGLVKVKTRVFFLPRRQIVGFIKGDCRYGRENYKMSSL